MYILKRKYGTGTGIGPGPDYNRVKTFSTSVFIAEKKEDLNYDFSPFSRDSISREYIPELWDSLKEGEITEFMMGWRNSSTFNPGK